MCCGKLTPLAPRNSSVLGRLQKQECDKDSPRTAVESEFQAAGPETVKLRDPYRVVVLMSLFYYHVCSEYQDRMIK